MATKKEYTPPTQEEIAFQAYLLWEKEGSYGRDQEYWLQAEAQLIAARKHEAGLLSSQPSQQSEQNRAMPQPQSQSQPQRNQKKSPAFRI